MVLSCRNKAIRHWRRHRWYILTAVMLLCLMVFWFQVLPWILLRQVFPVLASSLGQPQSSCRVRQLGFSCLDLTELSISSGPGHALTVDSIRVDYGFTVHCGLVPVIERVCVTGMEVHCRWASGMLMLEGLDLEALRSRLTESKRKPGVEASLGNAVTGPGVEIGEIDFEHCLLVLEIDGRQVCIPFRGRLLPEGTTAMSGHLRLMPRGEIVDVAARYILKTKELSASVESGAFHLARFTDFASVLSLQPRNALRMRLTVRAREGYVEEGVFAGEWGSKESNRGVSSVLKARVSGDVHALKASISAGISVRGVDVSVNCNDIRMDNSDGLLVTGRVECGVKGEMPMVGRLPEGLGISCGVRLQRAPGVKHWELVVDGEEPVDLSGEWGHLRSTIPHIKYVVADDGKIGLECKVGDFAFEGGEGRCNFRDIGVQVTHEDDVWHVASSGEAFLATGGNCEVYLPRFSAVVKQSGGTGSKSKRSNVKVSATTPGLRVGRVSCRMKRLKGELTDMHTRKGSCRFVLDGVQGEVGGSRVVTLGGVTLETSSGVGSMTASHARVKCPAFRMVIPEVSATLEEGASSLRFKDGDFTERFANIQFKGIKMEAGNGAYQLVVPRFGRRGDGSLGRFELSMTPNCEDNTDIAGAVDTRLLNNARVVLDGHVKRGSGWLPEVLLRVRVPELRPLEPLKLEQWFPQLDDMTCDGKLRMDLELSLTGGKPGLKTSLRVDDVSIRRPSKCFEMEGFSASVGGMLSDIASSPTQRAGFRILKYGDIELSNGFVLFQLRGMHGVLIEEAGMEWCGGKVISGPIRIEHGAGSVQATFFADRLSLPQLLNQLSSVNAAGNGFVVGKIPVTISGGGLTITDAYLFSAPQESNRLQLGKPEALLGSIPLEGALQTELAYEAMRDFEYKWLRILFNGTQEELKLRMQLDGKPARPLPYSYDKEKGSFVRSTDTQSRFQGITLNVNGALQLNKLLKTYGNLKKETGGAKVKAGKTVE